MARIDNPRELFVHKLGAALTMEETVAGLLEKLQREASDPRLWPSLEQHQRQTRRQIENIHRAFEALGRKPESRPCPAIDGLEQEVTLLIGQVGKELVDSVILDGVIEIEHYEIAVYDELIISAETIGEEDLVPLFQENREQEVQTLDVAVTAAEQLSYRLAKQHS